MSAGALPGLVPPIRRRRGGMPAREVSEAQHLRGSARRDEHDGGRGNVLGKELTKSSGSALVVLVDEARVVDRTRGLVQSRSLRGAVEHIRHRREAIGHFNAAVDRLHRLPAFASQTLPEPVIRDEPFDAGDERIGVIGDEHVLTVTDSSPSMPILVVMHGVPAISVWIILRLVPAPNSNGTSDNRACCRYGSTSGTQPTMRTPVRPSAYRRTVSSSASPTDVDRVPSK